MEKNSTDKCLFHCLFWQTFHIAKIFFTQNSLNGNLANVRPSTKKKQGKFHKMLIKTVNIMCLPDI